MWDNSGTELLVWDNSGTEPRETRGSSSPETAAQEEKGSSLTSPKGCSSEQKPLKLMKLKDFSPPPGLSLIPCHAALASHPGKGGGISVALL